jgi:hypothetical protein
MDKEEANQILKDNKMTKVRFAQLIGLKVGTVRTAFGANKLSKRMIRRLEKLDIRSEEKKPSITEGMIRQTMDIPVKQTLEAKIIGFPTNKFLRIIRFEDGTEGKFKCKPSKHRKMGEQVSVRLIEGDMWLLVR